MDTIMSSGPVRLTLPSNAGDNVDSSDSPQKADKSSTPIATIQENEPIVTKAELWSYYLYSSGDNGVGPSGYTQILFQSLATAAGYDPTVGPSSSCRPGASSGQCVLPWMGGTKSIASIVLVANGISFAMLTVILTTIGSAADYGSFGRWLLFIVTVICWVAQYACMALTSPDRWRLAMGLYIVGLISYSASLVFYAAAFPRLARNTPHSRSQHERYENGDISLEEYEREESLEKNRICNISTVHNNVGYFVTNLLNLALLLPHKTANNPRVDNYTLALDNSYWVLLGIWWFIYQSHRPGPPLPKGKSYLTIGWKQIWAALKTCRNLPYTFVYLSAIFLLADGVNTTVALVSICQNDRFSFSFLQTTYLSLSQAFASIIGTFAFWYVQRYWKISTKKMFVITTVMAILVPLWGMIGIWTSKLGFHNVWEFWAFNVTSGLFQAPYYAFALTMMAELSPPGFDNMFFCLYGLSNRTSSMVGPYIIQAIIDNTGNNWYGFPFLFAISTAASLVVWFGVDVAQGRRDAVRWALAQRDRIPE